MDHLAPLESAALLVLKALVASVKASSAILDEPEDFPARVTVKERCVLKSYFSMFRKEM